MLVRASNELPLNAQHYHTMNLIVSRINGAVITLNSGKSVNPVDCIVSSRSESGMERVAPRSKKDVRLAFKLTASEAEFVHRQVCLRLKQAESAAFSVMSSDNKVVGLGMKRTSSGATWFGLVEREEKRASKAAPNAAAMEANEKLVKLQMLLAKLGVSEADVAAALA